MKATFTGKENIRALAKRNPCSHKGENGSVLIIAGSKKYHGAEIFAAKAASLFADLVFVLTEKENLPHAKNATPLIIADEFSKKSLLEFGKKADSILIGPGLSENKKNKQLINFALKKFSGKKFVLDASALKLADKKLLNKNCILTPHAGEFLAAFGKSASTEEAKAQAKKWNCIIVLKGPNDIITDRIRLYKNKSGNALLTAGGTGDVLAGTIAAFAAKNSPLKAALAGTYLVGFAGDLIAKENAGLNAEMLIEMLPKAKKKSESC
ncbi:MAG: NAD(P)H-hydrate dehydratase [Candidatus Diapherotrites archaeon]|nr:NAD(P)H-hydrate dehydratase [Candidatus Diapherotrites archaeon]